MICARYFSRVLHGKLSHSSATWRLAILKFCLKLTSCIWLMSMRYPHKLLSTTSIRHSPAQLGT